LRKYLLIFACPPVRLRFQIRIELGDGKTLPSAETAQKANAILKGVKEGLQLK
jgi:hypothetical protein